jgi:hypothetical protein
MQNNNNNIFFPFYTCEEPYNNNNYIAQPVSAIINIITCIILAFFLIKAKTKTIKLLLLSFIIFQGYHAYSHIKHIDGSIQSNVIHTIWYFLTFMILLTSIKITNKRPSIYMIIILIIVIIIDLYILIKSNIKLYMIFSAFMLPIIIVLFYYKYYPSYIKKTIPYLIILLFVVIILILNEKFNCELMMSYANLPYHGIIEILGLILFTILGYIFFKSEKNDNY